MTAATGPDAESALTDAGDEPVDPEQPFADAAHDSAALRRSRRRSAAVSLVLVAIAVTLTVIMLIDPLQPWVQPFDDWWYRLIADHRTAWLTRVAEVLAVVGSAVVTVPLRIAIVALLAFRRRWTQLAAFGTAILVSELCIGPLKLLVGRPRPPRSLVELTTPSFPSGHAIAAAVTAFGLVVAFLPRGRRRLVWIGVATFVASSMAWSRTYLAAHWATDTIAGICIGVAAALLCEVAFESSRTVIAEHHPTEADPSGAGPDRQSTLAAAPTAMPSTSPGPPAAPHGAAADNSNLPVSERDS